MYIRPKEKKYKLNYLLSDHRELEQRGKTNFEDNRGMHTTRAEINEIKTRRKMRKNVETKI